MSVRSTIEVTGAFLGAVALIGACIIWVQEGDAQAVHKARVALTGHVHDAHTRMDTALLNRLSRLETKVDSNVVQNARTETMLRQLDRRTEIILHAVVK